LSPLKVERLQIPGDDKGIKDADRIVLRHGVGEALKEDAPCMAVHAVDRAHERIQLRILHPRI
jgi:hypothetical protein